LANIAVIEDHPPVLKLIFTLCRAEGHAVRAFDDGRAGLDAIRELSPDVALVGRRLGGTDGLRPGCGLKFDLGNFPPVTH
jgi:hypothetical protein